MDFLGHALGISIYFTTLTMKYYIYVMKIKKVTPTFQLYIRYLKHRIQIEKQIAINQDKLYTHDTKYEKLNNILHD